MYFFIWLGLICSAIQGMVSPVFGIYYGKTIFSIFADDYKKSCDYCLILALISAVSFIATYFQKISFGIIGENMTKSLRQEIYTSLLKKHIGWFDLKENNAGALTEILSSDVYHLNGASTEAISTIIETMVGLLGGVIIAFFYEWRTALVALGLSPFLTISNAIQVKLQMGFTEMQEGPLKEANLIISDSISNYKTVASFGHEALIVETLQNKLQGPMKSGNKRAHYAGIVFGWATFIQNIVFAALFYLGAVFIKEYGVVADDVFIAIYVIAFASFGAGQAQQFGPATGKAAKSAERIFGIMDEPSDIDVTKAEPREVIANEDTMKGEIEFRNVWFRYPTRKQAWVLKNFSLKINAQETVALVGESGSGKSTIVQLLYRFYDPQFGEIYIDKVNLKDYNLKSLRRQLGLVQQEPVLFNESIEYNITYGIEACNEKDVIRAVEIANASGFISKLGNMPINQNEKVVNHKGEVVSNEAAQYIDEKEEDDKNTSEEDISKGLKAICGVKGGKLSGGQKQRVAIARAVIRDPKILLLDEATSALDEVSQRKVKVALEKLMEGRTSIIIAHRLTTIEGADRIIELNNGMISKERPGKGKDNQLLNKN